MSEEQAHPRRSPKPCSDDCPGWGVFVVGVDLCIERCDDCWYDVPDAPTDEYYIKHPDCINELNRECEAEMGETGGGEK